MEKLLEMSDLHTSEAMLEFKIRDWQIDHTDRSKKQIEIAYYSRVIFRGEKIEILLNQISLKKSNSSDIIMHFSNAILFEEYKLQAEKLEFNLSESENHSIYSKSGKFIEFKAIEESDEITHEIRIGNSSN